MTARSSLRNIRISLFRDELIQEHLGFARMLAHRLLSRLPRCVDVEDLEADAYLGLLKAAGAYDPDRGVRFCTYAARRIFGAILDGLRERNGIRRHTNTPRFLSLETLLVGGNDNPRTLADSIPARGDPVGNELEMRDEAEFILRLLDRDDRQQLTDRHLRELKQREIAEYLGVTESAVSQRLSRIRERVRGIRCRRR